MSFKIRINKHGMIEELVYLIFWLLPFILPINTLIFDNKRILGIGVLNLFFDICLLFVFLDSLLNYNKYKNVRHIYFFMVAFFILHVFKFLNSTKGFFNFLEWFPMNQYYYLIPLVMIMLKNKKLNIKKIANELILTSCIICPISIFLFLSNNYFDMVTEINMIAYTIVGTPFTRMFSVFGSPLTAGTYFALIMIILIYSYDSKRVGFKIIFFMNLLCLILTFSRAAFIAFIAVSVYMFLFEGRIKFENRILKILIVFILVILGVIFISNTGVYFWDAKDIFHNIRLQKWAAGLIKIKEILMLGDDFKIHISTFGSQETTLSDNSFLLAIGHFGIIFWMIIFVCEFNRLLQKPKNEIKMIMPVIIFGGIIMFLYDFIQMFPGNYILLFLYIFLDNKYEVDLDKNNMGGKNEISHKGIR